jgi:hypothetical protein
VNATTLPRRHDAMRRACIGFLNTNANDPDYEVAVTNLHNASRRLLHAIYAEAHRS